MRASAILIVALVMAACGGGGGGSDEPRPPLEAIPSTVNLGEILVDDEASADLTLKNNTDAAITITSISLPAGELDLDGPALPAVLQPGDDVDMTLRFAPTEFGTIDGSLQVDYESPASRVSVPVYGSAGGQETIELGTYTLDSNLETPLIGVDVPADAISLSIEGLMGKNDLIDLMDLYGPGGRVYIENGSSPAFRADLGLEGFHVTVPNNDQPSYGLVVGGGRYEFRLKRVSGFGSSMEVRVILERRPSGFPEDSVLNLNVWLAPGLDADADNAPTHNRLQAILNRCSNVLAQQGIVLGDIDYYDVGDSDYNNVTSSEFDDMLRLTKDANRTRLNVFFVVEALRSGVVGASASVGGVAENGTGSSGIMVVFDGLSTTTLGTVTAHEIGHYLGLEHTIEDDGTRDLILDTGTGGNQLMNWQYLGGTLITESQGMVMRGHPLVDPEAQFHGFVLQRLPAAEDFDTGDLPEGWCATCDK